MRLRPTLISFLIVVVACLLVGAAYWPGRLGPFIFDDAANLPALGIQGPIDNAAAFARYITSGKGDPTGRPIALLSFLTNAQDWPADPLPFKLTNIAIHLVNGVLLWALLLRLGAAYGFAEHKRQFAALLASVLWLSHPLLVSTVLYVVQREAMLPATFALLAMHCWLRGRQILLDDERGGAAWIVGGVGAFTALAALSKANGLLIPVLVLAIDACLPSVPGIHAHRYRQCLRIGILPAAALVVGWIALDALRGIGAGPIAVRGWSVGQRMLTEPSIMLDYLAQLWLIKPADGSVFHDNYPVASSLFFPWYVLPSILLWVGAGIGAWLMRRHAPSLALAILFFMGGHLLESTSVPLELYFEHRNYLPSMLMFWPLAILVTRIPKVHHAAPLAILLIAGPLALTWTSADVWGRPVAQAVQWATLHPGSPRAQAYAAQIEAASGHVEDAVRRIDNAAIAFTDEPQIAFNVVNLHCMQGQLGPADAERTGRALARTSRDPGALLSQWFGHAIDIATSVHCEGLTLDTLKELLDRAATNPAINALTGRQQDISYLRGRIALEQHDAAAALIAFNRALAAESTPQVALSQAALLGAAGYPTEGLAHLDYYETLPPPEALSPAAGMPWLHALVLRRQQYWPRELAHLRQALLSDPHRAPHA
jgi:tetratricopeptide (TPR) repeat protein